MHDKDQPKDARTSGYNAEIAGTICERLMNGESLRTICADPVMPARATVLRWLASSQEFRQLYVLARQCGLAPVSWRGEDLGLGYLI
jgi:hypothetical protein